MLRTELKDCVLPLEKAGLVMNRDKFQFGQDLVEFAGMQVTQTGVRPTRDFRLSIENFPVPTNISEVRSFLGMVRKVNYAFAINDTMEPFRHHLKPGTPFLWSLLLQEKFVLAKEMNVKAAWQKFGQIMGCVSS